MTGQAPEYLTSLFIKRGSVSGRIIKPGAFNNLTFLFLKLCMQQDRKRFIIEVYLSGTSQIQASFSINVCMFCMYVSYTYKQKKLNRVMLNGDGNESGIKINRSNRQKNKFARAARFFVFLCRCFVRLQCRFV